MPTPPRNPGPLRLRAGGLEGTPIERRVRVVTLLHGGGPVASEGDHPQRPTRKPDEVTPMRGASVRGQLRFWWRATHGCTAATVAEMRAREDQLWGNASQPGLVELSVEGTATLSRVDAEGLGLVGQGLRYGAFATSNVTRVVGDFGLRCVVRRGGLDAETCARLATEVDDAVTAWLLFGGVGGRTRRGFGAVSNDRLPDPVRFVARFTRQGTLRGVPTLHGATVKVSARAFASADEAHRMALDKLRELRQGVNVGRNPGQAAGRPGRSRWPEADTLRRDLGTNSPGHAPAHPVRKYPRAAFGLPIVFQFKDRTTGDPPTAQLVPGPIAGLVVRGRMASPLILRPTPRAAQWAPLALRLHVPGVALDDVRVVAGQAALVGRARLDGGEAARVQPLQENGAGVDVIAAFLPRFQ